METAPEKGTESSEEQSVKPATDSADSSSPAEGSKSTTPSDDSSTTTSEDDASPSPSSELVEQPKKHAKFAITSSVFTSNYAHMALMLGYSIAKHNDLAALNAELVLLCLEDDAGINGITRENRTRLEKAGWKIRIAEELEFPGVNQTQIRKHHRHNLNKLHLFSWTEYDKIVFMDADTVCKGSIQELLQMPGEFAASNDVWHDIPVDTRFNSGVMVFKPKTEIFDDMITKVSDPHYHKPNDADQAFLQVYWKYRFYTLPFKFNFNLIMFEHWNKTWKMLWDEAIIIHFTIRKPRVKDHCHKGSEPGKGCSEWEPLEWYAGYWKEMLHDLGFEDELPLLG
ncbi:glycosyltransferase family 8 protein [Aulographum hederae CBS 113979]|uniref:Glycosyltransferase family 8 protein n=1 Tax=Aulographum hederae CBS 113979 TaxID=1176131 RepID=A0A6G1H5D0_9PEZI|nr:glycosyltransferase family 8 protein [Aulographum hederae CBS 113979]